MPPLHATTIHPHTSSALLSAHIPGAIPDSFLYIKSEAQRMRSIRLDATPEGAGVTSLGLVLRLIYIVVGIVGGRDRRLC